MADKENHLAVAQKNQELIEHLLKTVDRHSEWVAVVAFYKALHLVDALLFCDHPCKHGGDHKERYKTTSRAEAFRKIISRLDS